MKLKEIIALTYAYYNQGKAPQDAVLAMYAEDLADLDPIQCIDAYNRYRKNPKNRTFPLPAQIRELVCPDEFISTEAQAREIAARIVGAISQFGWNNGRSAEVYIGPAGWSVVQRQGGWNYLCENMGTRINPTTFQAQVRDQVEGSLRYGLPAIESQIGASPSRISGELVQANFARLLGEKPDDEPEGAA